MKLLTKIKALPRWLITSRSAIATELALTKEHMSALWSFCVDEHSTQSLEKTCPPNYESSIDLGGEGRSLLLSDYFGEETGNPHS